MGLQEPGKMFTDIMKLKPDCDKS